MAIRSNWRAALAYMVALLLFCALWHFYLHPHLWPFLSKQSDSFLAIALYVAGGLLALLGIVVSFNPPKTGSWKGASKDSF
ncbi:MAG: hypothetical protein ABR910_14230 [Acidobacteriaceae bacterium]|jgi:hypothetical protein